MIIKLIIYTITYLLIIVNMQSIVEYVMDKSLATFLGKLTDNKVVNSVLLLWIIFIIINYVIFDMMSIGTIFIFIILVSCLVSR